MNASNVFSRVVDHVFFKKLLKRGLPLPIVVVPHTNEENSVEPKLSVEYSFNITNGVLTFCLHYFFPFIWMVCWISCLFWALVGIAIGCLLVHCVMLMTLFYYHLVLLLSIKCYH